MPTRPPQKMTMAERAKQFAPFSALGGLDEALAKMEREIEARQEKKYQIEKSE